MPKRKNNTKKQKSRKSAVFNVQDLQPVFSKFLPVSSYHQHDEPKAVMMLDLSKLGGRMRKSQFAAWLRLYTAECEKRGWDSSDQFISEEDFVLLSHYSNWFNLPSTCWPIIAEHLELDGEGFREMLTVCKAFLAKEQDFLRATDFVRNSDCSTVEEVLREAAEKNIPKLLKWSLWKNGLDVNSGDEDNMTALHLCAEWHDNVDIAGALVSANANVNAVDENEWSPLHFAIRNGNFNTARFLMDHDANVQACTAEDFTPLSLCLRAGAGMYGHVEVAMAKCVEFAKHLIASGAQYGARFKHDINRLPPALGVLAFEPGCANQLTYSVWKCNNVADVQWCLSQGADVNAFDEDDYSALQVCARYTQNMDVMQTLINNGADVYLADKLGWTALHICVRYTQNIEFARALISAGADVNLSNKNGCTALHFCTRYTQNIELARILIRAGADANLSNKKGWTTLLFCVRHCDNVELLNLLVSANADITAETNRNDTAVHLACIGGNSNTLKQLLSLGLRADPVNGYHRTALHYASLNGHANCIREVLSYRSGASTKNFVDEDGDTPLALCMKSSTRAFSHLFDFYRDLQPTLEQSIKCAKILIASGCEYGNNLEDDRRNLPSQCLRLLPPYRMSAKRKNKYRVAVIHND